MFRKSILALGLWLLASPALAQNTTCSDRPTTDNSNACANTRFVHNAAGNLIVGTSVITGGTNQAPLFNNAGVLGNGAVSAIWSTYLQVGTGAVSRTVQAKLQETVSATDFGFVCDGITDNTTALNNAITSISQTTFYGGTIEIPAPKTPSFCIVAGTINLNTKIAITIRGVAGFTGGAFTTSNLLYTGTGARFIDGRDGTGNRLQSLYISYNNPAFTGSLVDCGGNTPAIASPPTFGSISSSCSLDNVTLAPSIGGSTPAATLWNMDQSIEGTANYVNFTGGAPSIRGSLVLASNSTVLKVRNSQFISHVGPAIVGCGDSWAFDGNTFEADSLGKANAFSNATHPGCKGLSFSNGWYADIVTSGGTWFNFNGSGFSFTGAQRIVNVQAASSPIFLFSGTTTGVTIDSATIENTSAVIDCTASTTGINLKSITWSGATTFFNNLSNCHGIQDQGNSPSTSQATNGQLLVGQTSADALWKTSSGDLTTSAAGAFTLATVNSNVGTFGDGTHVSQVTVNGKGLVTAASNVAITGAAPTGSAGGDLTGTYPNPTLAAIITAGGPTGSATIAPIIAYDAKGRLTAVSSATITPAIGSITGLGTGVATALGTNVGSAGAFVTFNGALGTPSSGTLTNATGLPTTGLTGTLQAAQEPAHTGDVTNSAGSLALTIAANAVTNAKAAQMATNTVKGNATSGTANATDLSVGSCSTAGSALIWTTNTGFGCNTSITASSATTATTATNATNTAITDDTTTNAVMYPTWVTANTGNLPQKVTSTKLTFNPSTGALFLGTNSLTPASGTQLTVSQNTGGTPGTSAIANILQQYIAADTTIGLLTLDTFGAQSSFSPRHASGTQLSKTATTGATTTFSFGGQGWDTVAYGSGAAIDFITSASTWSASNHGMAMRVRTVVDGSTSLTERLRIQQGLSIGDTVDPLVGGLRATGATIQFTGLASDAATTDNTVCVSSAGTLLKGSGTIGICLGTSSAKFKHDIVSMGAGLAEIVRLNPKNFFYNKGYGDDGHRQQYGLIAEDVVKVLPGITSADKNGKAQSVDLLALVPILVNAMKQLKADNDNLRMDVLALQAKAKK